jgi:hypothetical protein
VLLHKHLVTEDLPLVTAGVAERAAHLLQVRVENIVVFPLCYSTALYFNPSSSAVPEFHFSCFTTTEQRSKPEQTNQTNALCITYVCFCLFSQAICVRSVEGRRRILAEVAATLMLAHPAPETLTAHHTLHQQQQQPSAQQQGRGKEQHPPPSSVPVTPARPGRGLQGRGSFVETCVHFCRCAAL